VILFLTRDDVLYIHQDQIARYGGDAAVRDTGLLDSAIAQPSGTFGGQWLHEFPHGMAAAYAFHLVSNHPFVDGNKRTGFASALSFLDLNEYRLQADRQAGEQIVLAVAQGLLSKDRVIDFFRQHVQPK
jgi:death on curing protein